MMAMTKSIKIAISLSLIVMVITFVSLGLYLTNLSKQKNDLYSDYFARKQELVTQQQKLELTLATLNETLQAEKTKFLQLTEQASTIESQPTQTPSQPVQTQPVAPMPVRPIRVTRAS